MKTKKLLLSFFLVTCSFLIISCEKDEVNLDVTAGITGDYLGTYSDFSNATITSYTVVVTRANNSRIRVSPKSGNEFETFEISMEMTNDSIISDVIVSMQGLQNTAQFILSTPPVFSFSLNLTEERHQFVGEKQ